MIPVDVEQPQTTMMLKTGVIRLWVVAIFCGGAISATSAGRLRAQTPAPVTQASQTATKTLLDKARALEARGRMDLAVQTWQEVLLGDPRNTEALGGLARAAKLAGNLTVSNSYLERLRAISPNDPHISEVEHLTATAGPSQRPAQPTAQTAMVQAPPQASATGLTPDQKLQLKQAATLSDDGKYPAAMAIYRRIFGTHPPPGDYALAYYETESATPDGRPAAVVSLRGLVERYPSDSRYQIALGRVLTYNPATREEGRTYLAKFPADQKAAQALRQSLLWDAANPAAAPQIRAYLAVHPDPQLSAVFQMEQRGANAAPAAPVANTAAPAPVPPTPLTAGTTAAVAAPAASTNAPTKAEPPPMAAAKSPVAAEQAPSRTSSSTPAPTPNAGAMISTARTRSADEATAYQALNANRIGEAEARFKAILANDPANPRALAGMGYVRMQQRNFLAAISFLEQAKRSMPDDKGLAAALETARFWFIMGEGQTALTGSDLTTAEKRFRAALELRPNSPEALEGLGGTLLKAQQPGPAAPMFERAVAAAPASVEGWRGLFLAQLQSGNAQIALATDKKIPAAVHTQLMNDPLYLQPLASAYSAVGQSAQAQATLELALKSPFPPDVKGLKTDIQMQLASLLFLANKLDQAAALYAQMVATDHESLPAWEGLVRAQHLLGHDVDALKSVQSMPRDVSETAMRDSSFEVTVAAIYQSQQKFEDAQSLLQKAVTQQTSADQKPSPAIQMQLAGVYAAQGSPQLAYPIYQQVIRDNPDRADAWEGLLSALHVTGHDKEVVEQLKLISAGVRAQLEKNPAYLQTMADVYAALGRSREATMFLGRVEQSYVAQRSSPPAAVEIQNAWLLFNGMDDAGLYRQLMTLGGRTDLSDEQRRTVQTIWTNWAVRRANQAVAMGNPRRSLAILNAAAHAFPDNPAAIKALAIGYAQAGQPHQAVLIYKSQNLASGSAADYEAAVGAALADGDNKDAEIWLRYALAAYPADPQILILGAKFEQQRGDTARAIKYYRASLKAMPPVSPGSKLAAELGIPAPTAPMSLPNHDQPQDLSTLLAPGTDANPGSGASEPYLPSYTNQTALPPYDGQSRVVPPYMSNPKSGVESQPEGSPALARMQGDTGSPVGQAEVESTVRTATSQVLSQAPQNTVSGDEVYRPYVAYVAPPPSTPALANGDSRSATGGAVQVQLGNNAPHPVQQQTEMTDVLPTAHYAPSARADQAAASQAKVAAARAARIRRLQEADAAAARIGQSHPPPEETIAAATENAQYTTQPHPQVPQPSTVPQGGFGNVPNTGAQQYPQPRTPPASGGQSTASRVRRIPETPAPAPVVSAPAVPEPVATPPAPAPVAPVVAAAPAPVAAPTEPIAGPAYPLAPPPTDAELRARNLPALRGYFEGKTPILQTPREQAESQLAALEASYSGWLGVTGVGRYRSGTSGLDLLYDVEAPAEASAVIGRSVRLTTVAIPVFLNSGLLNTSSFSTSYVPYLGTLAANAATAPAQQSSNGIGGELQLTTRMISLAAGYTPYEFLVRNLTGRFRWSPFGGHVSLFGERQAVKDTQLSYAGMSNPGGSPLGYQGAIWGGVISTTGGVRLDFAGNGGATNFYISGDGGVLTGQHVLNNMRFAGATGATFRVGNWPSVGSLTVGGTLMGMHYQYNEVGLSYGQGGYFSPSYYVQAAVPVAFEGHRDASFHYKISGSFGVRTFQQDEAPFYPLDPVLQASFVPSNGIPCTTTQAPSYNCGQYPMTVETAFNYAVNAEASYRVGEHWYGGAFLRGDNTGNYNTVAGGFFFRFVFRPQHSLESFPTGLFAVEGFRPIQIP